MKDSEFRKLLEKLEGEMGEKGKETLSREIGDGLNVEIRKGKKGTTHRFFTKYTIKSKGRRRGTKPLGIYPETSLREARRGALEAQESAAKGEDPHPPKAEKAERKKAIANIPTFNGNIPTFTQAARIVHTIHEEAENAKVKTLKEKWRRFENHTFPAFGDKPVDQIEYLELRDLIKSKTMPTRNRLYPEAREVFDYCHGEGWINENPARDPRLLLGLPQPYKVHKVKHHARVPEKEVASVLRRIRAGDEKRCVRLGFLWMALNGTRKNETYNARWDQIVTDEESGLLCWNPLDHDMKNGDAWLVPLSKQAKEILEEAEELKDGSGYIFPSENGGRMSDMRFNRALRRIGVTGEGGSVHGFRGLYSTFLKKKRYPQEVCKLAISHKIGDAVEAAYLGSLLDLRLEAAQEWADFIIPEAQETAKVISIRANA